MPTITRWFIKTGLLFFLLSLAAALLAELQWLDIPALRPLYWHMLMVGWITQIIFGISLWMFPGRTRSDAFRDHLKEWTVYLFLNGGLVLRVVSEPMAVSGAGKIWNVLLAASALFQWLAVAVYVWEIWPRVQSKKKQLQNRKRS